MDWAAWAVFLMGIIRKFPFFLLDGLTTFSGII